MAAESPYEAMRRRNQLALAMMNQNRVDTSQGPFSALAGMGQQLASAFMARGMMDREDQQLKADGSGNGGASEGRSERGNWGIAGFPECRLFRIGNHARNAADTTTADYHRKRPAVL